MKPILNDAVPFESQKYVENNNTSKAITAYINSDQYIKNMPKTCLNQFIHTHQKFFVAQKNYISMHFIMKCKETSWCLYENHIEGSEKNWSWEARIFLTPPIFIQSAILTGFASERNNIFCLKEIIHLYIAYKFSRPKESCEWIFMIKS